MTGEEPVGSDPRRWVRLMGWVMGICNLIVLTDFAYAYQEAGSSGRRDLLHAALLGSIVGLVLGLIGVAIMRWHVRRPDGDTGMSVWVKVSPFVGVVLFLLFRDQEPAVRQGAFAALIAGADVLVGAIVVTVKREHADKRG